MGACEGLRCILKAELYATKTIMTQMKSVYTKVVDHSILQDMHPEEEDSDVELDYYSDDTESDTG